MMKRKIFFWLERLKITPAERKSVVTLLLILTVAASVNAMLTSHIPFGNDDYLELEKQFRARTSEIKEKQNMLMKRYHPSNKKMTAVAKPDTLPADSISHDNVKAAKKTSKERININNADIEALKSLPGIGPAYAGRIIKYRKSKGAFKTVEELKKIKGIGKKRLDKLKPFIKLTDSKQKQE